MKPWGKSSAEKWPWLLARPPRVSMGWQPENGLLKYDWQGYNEAMLLYVLALGFPALALLRREALLVFLRQQLADTLIDPRFPFPVLAVQAPVGTFLRFYEG